MSTTIDLGYDIDRDALRSVCRTFGVQWLAVFGSVARGEARPDSDVDVLVEFYKSHKPLTYFDLTDLADALSPIFGGRKIDLGRPEQLHWYFKQDVMREAQVLHAA